MREDSVFAVETTALRQKKERPKTLPSYPESTVPTGRAFGNVFSLNRQATPADRVLSPAAHRSRPAAHRHRQSIVIGPSLPSSAGKRIVSARRPPSRSKSSPVAARRRAPPGAGNLDVFPSAANITGLPVRVPIRHSESQPTPRTRRLRSKSSPACCTPSQAKHRHRSAAPIVRG